MLTAVPAALKFLRAIFFYCNLLYELSSRLQEEIWSTHKKLMRTAQPAGSVALLRNNNPTTLFLKMLSNILIFSVISTEGRDLGF